MESLPSSHWEFAAIYGKLETEQFELNLTHGLFVVVCVMYVKLWIHVIGNEEADRKEAVQ